VLLGRAAGLTDEKMASLNRRPLPVGLYEPDEQVIVEYAQTLTRMEAIDDALYAELRRHFSDMQIIDLCFIVGMSNLVNRFHATFLTDVDATTIEALSSGCPIPLPDVPSAAAQSGPV
jgi:alkylhydroperoxidase family enzyme